MKKNVMSLESAFYSLIEGHAPAAILLDRHDQLICSSSEASRYLAHGEGAPSLDIMSLLPKPVQSALSTALWQARQTGKPVVSEPVGDSLRESGRTLLLEVRPVIQKDFAEGCMLAFFHQTPAFRNPALDETTPDSSGFIASLQHALNQSHDELDSVIREHEESLGSLAASNEELHTINEELRCASEELESSKRELEVINRKLSITNEELERSVARAAKAHDDLQNFVAVTEIATIFVDRGMRIKSYTSPASALFNIRREDMGRPLLDLALTAEFQGLAMDMAMAFDHLEKIEREIRHGNGRWYLLRVAPYRTKNDFIEGVVMTFIDITNRREAEENLRLGEQRWKLALEASGDGLWDWDVVADRAVLSPTWRRIVGYEENGFTRQSSAEWCELIHPEDRARVVAALLEVSVGAVPMFSSEYRIGRSDGAWKWVLSRGASVEWDRDGKPTRVVGTMTDISEKKMSEHQIWYRANFDNLTGLPNRSFFLDRLEHEVRHSQRSGCAFALLFIDLDHFKEINDLHGHYSGDALLKQVAQRLKACTRASDTVARLGGDEFTVILSATDDVADVELICEKILERMAEPFDLSGQVVDISASVGITLYPRDAQEAGDLIRNADQAMYVAKNAGRNRCKFFTQAMQDAALARITIISDLHRAVPDQLRLYFQPVVDASTGRIQKAEALLRWQHPSRGLILPGEFIHLSEEAGFVGKIGDWVFAEAACWAQRWGSMLGRPFQVSVNKSPLEFLAGQHAPPLDWAGHLHHIGLDCRNISIEITEGVLLNANNMVRDKLLSLRQSGIEVAIDDFGTGYSSMAYLKKYSVDYLKIDQSFVRDMVVDPTSNAITETIIVMAHKLGLKVIAEGVETREQRDRLAAAGCDYIQGYFYSEALVPEEFELLLLNDQAPMKAVGHAGNRQAAG